MSTPTDPTAGERDWVRRVLADPRFRVGPDLRREELVDVIAGRLARKSAAATRARAEALREAADALRSMAAQEFDIKGPRDPRGAAIWDSASWLTERADSLAPDTAGESA